MTSRHQIYRCEVCGNIVEVLHPGTGILTCCGQPMTPLEEKTTDKDKEKHVPVVKEQDGALTVTVGSIMHPMEEKHFIEWIELITDKGVERKYLKSGNKPEAVFKTTEEIKKVREYCTVHGLWRK